MPQFRTTTVMQVVANVRRPSLSKFSDPQQEESNPAMIAAADPARPQS